MKSTIAEMAEQIKECTRDIDSMRLSDIRKVHVLADRIVEQEQLEISCYEKLRDITKDLVDLLNGGR